MDYNLCYTLPEGPQAVEVLKDLINNTAHAMIVIPLDKAGGDQLRDLAELVVTSDTLFSNWLIVLVPNSEDIKGLLSKIPRCKQTPAPSFGNKLDYAFFIARNDQLAEVITHNESFPVAWRLTSSLIRLSSSDPCKP